MNHNSKKLTEVEEGEEEERCLILLKERMQMLDLQKLPNWSFKSWLTGPAGFSALLSEKRVFWNDLFLSGEKFRMISLAEVRLTSEENQEGWTQDRQRRSEILLKRCLPLSCPCPPTLRDQKGSGFNFSLGKRGSSIGLYKTIDGDLTSNESVERYFIVCHTGLPEDTIHEMQNHDDYINYQNLKATNQLENIEEGLHSLPSAELKSQKGKKVTTYGMVFGNRSVNERMKQISLEHSKRLINYVSELLELPLISIKKNIQKGSTGRDKNPSVVGELYSEGVDYRVENVQTQKYLNTSELLIEALTWWPRNAPILNFYILPEKRGYKDEDVPPRTLQGYPLGPILYWLKQKDEQQFEQLKERFKIRLIEKPRTFDLDLKTDYNTYRIDNQGNVRWYSNSTPTDSAARGIIQMLPLTMGFEIIRPNFMKTTTDRPRNSLVESSFDNYFKNSYPVVFSFEPEKNRNITPQNLSKFVYPKKNEEQQNKQLKGKFNMSKMVEKEVESNLNAKKEKYQTQIMRPMLVYLSEEPFLNVFEDYIFDQDSS